MTRTTGEMPLWTWRLTKMSWRSSMLAPCRVSASTLHASRSPTASTATCRGHWIPGTLLLLERIQSGVPLFGQQHVRISGMIIIYGISKWISGAPSWMSPKHLQKTRTKEKWGPQVSCICLRWFSHRSHCLDSRGKGARQWVERIQSPVLLFGQQRQGC